MQHLLGSTQTLLLAALLLVITASLPALPALQGGASRSRLFVYLGAFLTSAALFWLAVRQSSVLPGQVPYRVVRYAVAELEQASETNVLLIDGGSYVWDAVDTDMLEAELKLLGYSARAVRLAAGAANHFERYHMQECVLRRLARRPNVGQRWLYLTEIHNSYDHRPLAQFDDNQDTARTYRYTTLNNGWHAARALSRADSLPPLDGNWRWPLFRHVLINSFNAGAFSQLVGEQEIAPADGLSNPRKRSRFKFLGLTGLLKAAKQPPTKATVPSWLFDVREPRSRRLWQHYTKDFVYFGVPSTTREQLDYVRSFCQATQASCLAPTDPELLQALDNKAAWRNSGHMTLAGAKIYSPWLARALASSGVLKK